jgi:hypothetical protein
MGASTESLMASAQLPSGDAKIKPWRDENLHVFLLLSVVPGSSPDATEGVQDFVGTLFHSTLS